MGAPADRFSERLGWASQKSEKDVIWFHAASLGEVAQIRPLVERLNETQDRLILVTTNTASGSDWVAQALPLSIHQYAPLDVPSAVDRFLNTWKISVAVFIEGDIWPRIISETQKRNIPRVLLNARHSRSRERYALVYGNLLSGFSKVTCRSETVANGIRALGVADENVEVLPDLRITTPTLPSIDAHSALMKVIGSRPVWLAASTHRPDEAPVLKAHKQVLKQFPDALLIIAPRHPKRNASLFETAREMGFDVSRRGNFDALSDSTQVYLADTLGELSLFFSVAPIAFIGGSIGDEGGHNPYEPASLGTAILSGANVINFQDSYEAFAKAGAAKLLKNPNELGDVVLELIQSGQDKLMSAAGLAFMAASDDGVAASVRHILEAQRDP